MSKSIKISFFWCLLLSIGVNNALFAQVTCSGSTPKYTIDLTGNADSVWTSPSVSRSGQCCGVTTANNCIKFTVTLDTNSYGVAITTSGGSTANYYSNCAGATPLGDTMCLTGVGPHEITLCDTGSIAQVYTITSITRPYLERTIFRATATCPAELVVKGLVDSTITWRALINSWWYNSLISCTLGCDTTIITPLSWWTPTYVDYIVTGTIKNGSCASGTQFTDTVRVYMHRPLTLTLPKLNFQLCNGIVSTSVTATPNGGLAPYKVIWSTGDTANTVNLTAGTYQVRATDSTGCYTDYQTVTVSTSRDSVYAGKDTTICSSTNLVYLNGTMTSGAGQVWTGRGGMFVNDDSTRSTTTYIPSLDEVEDGYTYLVFSGTGVCNSDTDTVHISIGAPNPIIGGDVVVCTGSQPENYSVTALPGSSYDWHVVGGTITSGQNTNEISVKWGNSGPGYMYIVQTDSNGCEAVGAINTLSRYNFNTPNLKRASIGPDAIWSDPDAYTNGTGYQITSNCGGSKGIDLTIPGNVFNRGKLCMTFSWQRDESQADFFTRGGVTLRIRSGQLQVGMRIDDGAGWFTQIGPLNTGYTVPYDDIMRYFTFCYDSATGKAVVMQFDSVVWTYTGTPGRSLNWSFAGNAVIGSIMDGSCWGRTLIDWSNISVPITVIEGVDVSMVGDNKLCQYEIGNYEVKDTLSKFSYTWSVDSGDIISGQNSYKAGVYWHTAGNRTVSVVVRDTVSGCDTTMVFNVEVNKTPPTEINGNDTICQTIENIFTAPTDSNYVYQWTAATGTFNGATDNDSALITFAQGGNHTIQLKISDTASGCDSTTTFNIFVDSIPAGIVAGDNPVCEGSIASTYTYTPNNNLYTYVWSITKGTITNGIGTNSIRVTWEIAGTDNVKLVITTPGGCTREILYPVTIHPKPVLGPVQHR